MGVPTRNQSSREHALKGEEQVTQAVCSKASVTTAQQLVRKQSSKTCGTEERNFRQVLLGMKYSICKGGARASVQRLQTKESQKQENSPQRPLQEEEERRRSLCQSHQRTCREASLMKLRMMDGARLGAQSLFSTNLEKRRDRSRSPPARAGVQG